MRSRHAVFALLLVGALAPTAAADGGTGITVTTAFMMGSFKVADTHGFQAPGAHVDLGFRVRRWRLAAEIETGLWSEPHTMTEEYTSGGFSRLGMALQWAWKDLEIPLREGRPSGHFRGFVEVGLGRQHIGTDLGEVSRNDVMLGLGMSPDLRIGKVLFGATFDVRMLISRAPTTTIARGATINSDPSLDVALLYVFGMRFGH